jgi:hypothetical protein
MKQKQIKEIRKELESLKENSWLDRNNKRMTYIFYALIIITILAGFFLIFKLF